MRPALEFRGDAVDDSAGLRGSIWIPNDAIPVFLLQLYILRHEREFFTVVVQGSEPIRFRIGYDPEKSPGGGMEWPASGPLLLMETDVLDSWIYHLRPHFYGDRSRMIFEMPLGGDDPKTGRGLDLEVRIGQPPSRKARR